jgi:hypothetical protein
LFLTTIVKPDSASAVAIGDAYAAIRDLVTGAFRRAGYANIARARRLHCCDERRILTLYGYA